MKIEIDKPVIPHFVADWIENLYDEGGSKYDAIGSMFVYSSKYDKIVNDWFVNNKDDFIAAVMYGYEIEQEPLCYAKIKGSELLERDMFWYTYDYDGEVSLDIGSYGEVLDNMYSSSIKEWNNLGINDTNADFERVE